MGNNYIEVPIDLFRECVDAIACVKALEAHLKLNTYIDKKDIATICGFELKESET